MSNLRRTAKRLSVLVGVLVVLVVVALVWIELPGMSDSSTISELMWVVWAEQPWVVLLLSHMVAAPVWFLFGHFFSQSRDVYDELRKQPKR